MALANYAPNANILISADNLVFDNGDSLSFNSSGRMLQVFANRVTINGEPSLLSTLQRLVDLPWFSPAHLLLRIKTHQRVTSTPPPPAPG